MINENDILKRILLNMKYDSSMTLNENYDQVIYEQTTNSNVNQSKPDVDPNYDKNTKLSYQTVIYNEFLTVPLLKSPITPLEWHNSSEPYNEQAAKSVFGEKCLTLSGQNKKYVPGKRPDVDFFIDDDGNKCEPQDDMKQFGLDPNGSYIVQNDQVFLPFTIQNPGSPSSVKIKKGTPMNYDFEKKFISFGVYYTLNNKEVLSNLAGVFKCDTPDRIYVGSQEYKQNKVEAQLVNTLNKKYCKSGKIIDYTNNLKKFGTYKSGCKPIPFDICLKWSWKSLYEFGGVNKGLKKFELKRSKDEEPVVYGACISKSWFPWESTYTGFYDISKYETKYSEELDQLVASYCPPGAKTKLSSIPIFKIGEGDLNVNVSRRQNDEKAEELAYEKSLSFGKELERTYVEGSRTDMVKKVQNSIKSGIRIKGL
jgi:hypothetical protein